MGLSIEVLPWPMPIIDLITRGGEGRVVGLLARLGSGGNEDYGRQVRKIEGANFSEGEEISPRLGETRPVKAGARFAEPAQHFAARPVSIGKVREEALQQWQSTCLCVYSKSCSEIISAPFTWYHYSGSELRFLFRRGRHGSVRPGGCTGSTKLHGTMSNTT